MSSLLDILNTLNNALADDSGFDLSELDKAVAEMHLKLTEPEWAIEDETLREECQKLVVQWAAQRYLDGVTDLELDKPLADTDVANPPTPTDTNTSFKEQLERILKGYHDRLLMTETAYDIKQRNTALTSIINLVDKEVIGEDEDLDVQSEFDKLDIPHTETDKYPYLYSVRQASRNILKAKQRAIIRSNR